HAVDSARYARLTGQAVVIDHERADIAVVDLVGFGTDELVITPAFVVIVDVVIHRRLAVAKLQLELSTLSVPAQPQADRGVPGKIQRGRKAPAQHRPPGVGA